MSWRTSAQAAICVLSSRRPHASVVMVAGIAGAKSTDSGKIADYLHKDFKGYSGLSGAISFDAKGDREGEVYRVYKVDGQGKFVLQKL